MGLLFYITSLPNYLLHTPPTKPICVLLSELSAMNTYSVVMNDTASKYFTSWSCFLMQKENNTKSYRVSDCIFLTMYITSSTIYLRSVFLIVQNYVYITIFILLLSLSYYLLTAMWFLTINYLKVPGRRPRFHCSGAQSDHKTSLK